MPITLKPPLVALLFYNDYDNTMRKDVLSGRKQVSIRAGHRDYQPGQTIMLCCHIDIEPWVVMADITEVRHRILAEVSAEDLRADGFKDHAHMLEGLRKYYPTLGYNSPVTVIKWRDVRGQLVDEYCQDDPDDFREVRSRQGAAKE